MSEDRHWIPIAPGKLYSESVVIQSANGTEYTVLVPYDHIPTAIHCEPVEDVGFVLKFQYPSNQGETLTEWETGSDTARYRLGVGTGRIFALELSAEKTDGRPIELRLEKFLSQAEAAIKYLNEHRQGVSERANYRAVEESIRKAGTACLEAAV